MIPFLTYPLALIALAAVPALAAIYILRNRYRRRQVSSLLLWKFNVQSKAGGAKVHRLQLPLLFFLELLALFMLVVAATGPHSKLPQATRPLIVVLDDSFSMRAMNNGLSTQSRAKDFLKKLFRHQPPPFTRLILAGTGPRLLGASAKSWSEINDLLGEWNCWSPNASLETALTLASDIGKQQANILVLTDHKPADEKISNVRLEWHSFGAPLDNLAIVNASRTAFGDQDRCLLEIANLSANPHTTKIRVQTGTNSAAQSLLASLGANERQHFVFNIPANTPVLRAALENDPLMEDNEIQLLPALRKHVRVQVTLTNETLNALANRTLDATGLRAAISENPELIIHENDSVPNSNCWSLRWSSPTKAMAFTGPFIVDNSHPLAEGIALEGVIWAGAALTNSADDVPIILAGNTPLLSVREDSSGRRHLTLNLKPEFSTLLNTPDWPILFWNILQWRIAEKQRAARFGSDSENNWRSSECDIAGWNGKIFSQNCRSTCAGNSITGNLFRDDGQATNRLAVNPFVADESDLSACVTGQWGAWSNDNEHRFQESPLAWIFGLITLALLTTHLYLLTSGKGGR
ncbi:MAG: VWA domain-containing protein [Limisphaerales bacterium]